MGPPGDIRPKARLKLKYIKKTKPHSWLGKNDASKGPTKNVEDDLMTLYTVPRYKIVPYLLTVPCKIFHPSSISFQVKVFYALCTVFYFRLTLLLILILNVYNSSFILQYIFVLSKYNIQH